MAETQNHFKIDSSDGMVLFEVFALIILFWGEPDPHDAVIWRLMGAQASSGVVNLPQQSGMTGR